MAVDATQWHTYAVSWTPTQITTYVDGTPIFTTTDTATFPPGPMHWRSNWTSWAPTSARARRCRWRG